MSRYQKGKINLDFTEARDSEWQWHQLGHMQVCTSLQTDNNGSTPSLSFFTDRMPFLPPNQQHQSTEEYSLLENKHNVTDEDKEVLRAAEDVHFAHYLFCFFLQKYDSFRFNSCCDLTVL